MKYRKLRIAWSVAWGIVAVLFLALWSRSYHTHDSFYFRVPLTDIFGGDSRPGTVQIGSGKAAVADSWRVVSESLTTEQMTRLYQMPNDPMNEQPNRLGIGFIHPSGWTVLTFPDWMAVCLSLLLAGVSWLPGQFSLRTLLVTTTLIAVLLGVVVWWLK